MLNRREFLMGTGAFVAPFISGCAGLGFRANEKVNVAVIGIGCRGADDIDDFVGTGLVNLIAFADTECEAECTARTRKNYPNVPRYQDFRKMFEKHAKEIDAVLVATPDHSHFVMCMTALGLGKHVYTEKPMGNTFREIQLMMDMAAAHPGLVTQMGNQGHSLANYYQAKAMAEAGMFKGTTKIVAHMNYDRRWYKWNGKVTEMFPAKDAIPADLAWDTWLSQRPYRAFNPNYIHGDWRCFYEYGNGVLGDWGAHIFDTIYDVIGLGLPESVSAVNQTGWSPVVFPMSSTVKFKFPARGKDLPACELQWWEGRENFPELPKGFRWDLKSDTPPIGDVDAPKTKDLKPGREIYLADGTVYQGMSHGSELVACDGRKLPSFAAEHSTGSGAMPHAKNFLEAIRGNEVAHSPFASAGVLSQMMTIGCIAQRLQAKELKFDAKTKRFTAADAPRADALKLANTLLDCPAPRKGWESYYKI